MNDAKTWYDNTQAVVAGEGATHQQDLFLEESP
jgi:hypothetical protein